MGAIDDFISKLDDNKSGDKEIIRQCLGKLMDDDAATWINQVKITNRKVAGTRYKEIGFLLPFNDFFALYEALGYDFGQLAIWKDWYCGMYAPCTASPGNSCNTDTCK